MKFAGKKESLMSCKRSWLASLVAIGAVSVSGRADAQIDTNPPLQNLLLLVDTSGSMEFAPDGTKVTCHQGGTPLAGEPKGASQKNPSTQLVAHLNSDLHDIS